MTVDLRTIASKLGKFELELPPASSEALAVEDAVRAELAHAKSASDDAHFRDELAVVTPADAAELVRTVAARLTVADQARRISGMLSQSLSVRVRDAVAEDAEAIIVSMRPAWDAAADALAASRDVFGDRPDAEAIRRAGPAAGSAWAARLKSLETLSELRWVRVALMPVCGPGRQSAAMYVADVDSLELGNEVFGSPGNDLENLSNAGCRLRLNTAAEIAALGSNQRLKRDPEAEAEREKRIADLKHRWRHVLEPAAQ